MHHVRHVRCGTARGQVGREPEIDVLAGWRNGIGRVVHFRKKAGCLLVELNLREHLLVPNAAPRIGIHNGDELANSVNAVTHHLAGLAPGHRHQLTVHHQHAMIMTGDVALHNHVARVLLSAQKAGPHFICSAERNGHTAAVIAVVRLGDHGISNALGRGYGAVGGLHQTLLGHRQTQAREYAVGLFLVRREFNRDVRCTPGNRGLNALLIAAVSKLNETLVVQPQPRN